MADFSNSEKVNAGWKHLFGILGTANGDGAAGKYWFEEQLPATHIVVPADIWADTVPSAANITAAKGLATTSGAVVEDRSDGEAVTLVSNGSDWDITVTGFTPQVGYQLTDQHPSPNYIKSIINVVDNGGGSFTITLNNNTSVSAGSAVLQRRIFLTVDPTTNGLAWFSRSVYGNSFSSNMFNFIQPQLFGKGYTIRIFQANGSEIFTTQGAWIFNWQKGLLLFAIGQTPANLGYTTPIYIEGFRYIGDFGGTGASLPVGNLHDTLRFDGSNYVPSSVLQNDDTDVYIQNKLSVSGAVVLPSGTQPTSSGFAGDQGEFRWDNNFLYIKTALGWARTNLSYF